MEKFDRRFLVGRTVGAFARDPVVFFSIYVVVCQVIFVNTKVELSQAFKNSNMI